MGLIKNKWKGLKQEFLKDLNEFGHVAHIFLVLHIYLSHLSQKSEPLQFIYQAGKGVKDAKHFILNSVYSHQVKCHVRLIRWLINSFLFGF